MPNERWTDFALTERFQDLDRRLENYDDAIKGLAHFPIDVAKAALEIEHLAHEIQVVNQTCQGFHEEWQQSLESRQKGRTAIVVAVIAGCFTVLASLVALVATLAAGG
jgi:hypothetical protein